MEEKILVPGPSQCKWLFIFIIFLLDITEILLKTILSIHLTWSSQWVDCMWFGIVTFSCIYLYWKLHLHVSAGDVKYPISRTPDHLICILLWCTKMTPTEVNWTRTMKRFSVVIKGTRISVMLFRTLGTLAHLLSGAFPFIQCIHFCNLSFELPHDKTNKMACAPSEDSDQPRHLPSLIRVFGVLMKKAWVLRYPLSAQLRFWSDWADAQADLSPHWAHSRFVGFVMMRLILSFVCDEVPIDVVLPTLEKFSFLTVIQIVLICCYLSSSLTTFFNSLTLSYHLLILISYGTILTSAFSLLLSSYFSIV